MVKDDLEFWVDGVLFESPNNPEDFGIKINYDNEINAVYTTFDNDLDFGGQLYNYLFNKLKEDGFCGLVNVSVYYTCNNNKQLIAECYINQADCKFDYDKCSVKVKFIDDAFASKINNNKNIKFTIGVANGTQPVTKNGISFTPIQSAVYYGQNYFDFRNPATNTVLPSNLGTRRCIRIYEAFQFLVYAMSDFTVEFQSDYFDTGFGAQFLLTSGQVLYADQNFVGATVSFNDLYDACRKLFNLGIGFKRVNNKATLIIEEASYFQNSAFLVNLYDQPGITMNLDAQRLYSNMAIGSDTFLEEWQGVEGRQKLTFPQVAFRGFKSGEFGLTGVCNADSVLDLVVKEIIIDSNVIEDVIVNQNQNYVDNVFILQYDGNTAFGQIVYGDPLNIGQTIYNPALVCDQIATRWIGAVPNSIYEFYQGYDDTQLPFDADSDNSSVYVGINCGIAQTYLFDLNQPTDIATSPVYLSDRNIGEYVAFNVVNTNPGSNFDPNYSYYAPAPLLGTFNASIRIVQCLTANPGQIVYLRIVFKRFNAAAELIQTYPDIYTNYFVGGAFSPFALTHSANIFMNTGDYVRVDIEAYKTLAGLGAPILLTATSGSLHTSFDAIPVSLKGGELQAYDPADFKAFVYDFERPLSQAQIYDIINNPFNAIAFGRLDDSLAVIPGQINTVNIASIIRKRATFQLRSNKLLP
jgi:hypothetical protein